MCRTQRTLLMRCSTRSLEGRRSRRHQGKVPAHGSCHRTEQDLLCGIAHTTIGDACHTACFQAAVFIGVIGEVCRFNALLRARYMQLQVIAATALSMRLVLVGSFFGAAISSRMHYAWKLGKACGKILLLIVQTHACGSQHVVNSNMHAPGTPGDALQS